MHSNPFWFFTSIWPVQILPLWKPMGIDWSHGGGKSSGLGTKTSSTKSMLLKGRLNLFKVPQSLAIYHCLPQGEHLVFSLVLFPFIFFSPNYFDFWTTSFIPYHLSLKRIEGGLLDTWALKCVTEISYCIWVHLMAKIYCLPSGNGKV